MSSLVMPAEWEPHAATWLSWPHNVRDWPGKFGPIPWVYAEIVRRVSQSEKVRIHAGTAALEASARRVLSKAHVAMENVEFLRVPTDRVWTRDTGPIFVKRGAKKQVAHFRFNAWAKYPDWKRDARIAEKAARHVKVPLLDTGGAVMEGGALEVNGQGALLVTEECLLDPKVQIRNPGFSSADYERLFEKTLGISRTIWLGKGIAGDDTHGHIDDLARFTDANTVVLCEERNPADANYGPLNENRERLQSTGFEVVGLPMPQPLVFAGQRLPASYANFYICNAAVLVPTFDDPNDQRALGILGELFPGRPIVGIHCRDFVWGLGTLHCCTQQEPA